MTIRHLKIFITVAESGTMSAAAAKLYITQPTVSQVIAEIEEDYGVRLFERLAKKLYITDSGRELLSYARHIVGLFDEMEQKMKNASDRVLLRVGATITVGTCVMGGLIARFEEKHPEIRTKVCVANTQKIEEMLCKSELDLALVEGKIKHEELIVEPVIRDELVLVCGAKHPFFTRDGIALRELNGEPMILREEGSGTRELFCDCLEKEGVTVEAKWTCHTADAILNAVACNQGITVISKMLAAPREAAGELRIIPIRDKTFERSFSVVYHKNKYFSKFLTQLMKQIRSDYSDFG